MSQPHAGPVPRTVKGLSVVSLFNDFASEMVYPLLPAFMTGTLGAGPLALGALDGAADLTSAVLKIGSGRLSDRPRWRPALILLGYATAVLVRPLMAVAGTASQVVGFRVIDRMGKGLRTPPRDALIAAVTLPAQRGRAFGFHRGADHFGAVMGSLVAWGLLARGVQIREVIGWSALPGALAFAVLAIVLRRPGARHLETGTGSAGHSADASGRVFWAPVLALSALTLFRLPEALFLLRLQELGSAVAAVPLIWAGLHVVRSTSSYPGGWLSDRIGPRLTVGAGSLLFAAVALALASGPGLTGAIVAFLLLGLVAGLTESAERALVSRLAPVRTGRGFGVYHALTGLAALPAGLAFGGLYEWEGAAVALVASAAGVTAAMVGWLVVTRGGGYK